jgi:Flp pilus assembly protein TadG
MIIKQQLKLLRKFLNSQNASIAFIFAIALIPTMLFTGAAVDYSRFSDAKSKMQVISDSAALAAANATTHEQAVAEVNRLNGAHATDHKNIKNIRSRLVSFQDGMAIVETDGDVGMLFQAVTSPSQKSLTTRAQAQKASGWAAGTELYIAIDMSSSLTLPNTPAEVNHLESLTGCMFSCHQETVPDGRTKYKFARDHGITMREDVLIQAVTDIINNNFSATISDVRISIIGFSDDAIQLTPLTNDKNILIQSLNQFEHQKRLNTVYEVVLPQIYDMMKKSPSHASKKSLLLLTDGVRSIRSSNWGPIKSELCAPFKNDQIGVSVIELEYPQSPHENYYRLEVEPFYNEISPSLKACASEERYHKIKFGGEYFSILNAAFTHLKKDVLRIVK